MKIFCIFAVLVICKMMKNMKVLRNISVITIALALMLTGVNGWAQKSYQLVSPDRKLNATVSVGDRITFTLTHESTGILGASPVSMRLVSGEVLGEKPQGVSVKRGTVSREVASPYYKKSEVAENYNELVLSFKGNYGLVFRAYNEGLAYRFTTNRKDALTITAEEFTLHFVKDFMTFAPYSGGGEGSFEKQFYNSFESPYVHAPLSELDVKRLIFMPMLITLDDGKKLCITEADLYGFPGAWLNSTGETSLQVVHANYPKKSEPRGSSYFVPEREDYIAKTKGTRLFPWRLMIVSENDNARDITLDLSFPGEGHFKAELFTDGVNANRIASDYKKEVIDIPVNRRLIIKMAQGGGFAARIYK